MASQAPVASRRSKFGLDETTNDQNARQRMSPQNENENRCMFSMHASAARSVGGGRPDSPLMRPSCGLVLRPSGEKRSIGEPSDSGDAGDSVRRLACGRWRKREPENGPSGVISICESSCSPSSPWIIGVKRTGLSRLQRARRNEEDAAIVSDSQHKVSTMEESAR
jgi:hypothetical protein